ncbi:hypothetical protein DPMN_016584 [Dreissena polymorpha]|uniref:Uncharacterized protein n=1 Tax=Dreissena polymorpha TaxID=45954 RepID=A0A9D4NDS5_DREPO|nr:hypothetical protein DPMN_016584 [Dreissena polymorpha]
MEDQPARHTARLDAAVDTLAVQTLERPAVDVQHLEAGSKEPDVEEGDIGEFAAPLGGDTHATEQGRDPVAEPLPTVEASIGELPDTVDAMGAIGLGENIFKFALLI